MPDPTRCALVNSANRIYFISSATAIANMQALTRRHGPAPESAVVVPIVGAFFVDPMNLAVLTFFLLPGSVVPR
jgi:ESS family glutamate:Na+ symporter